MAVGFSRQRQNQLLTNCYSNAFLQKKAVQIRSTLIKDEVPGKGRTYVTEIP